MLLLRERTILVFVSLVFITKKIIRCCYTVKTKKRLRLEKNYWKQYMLSRFLFCLLPQITTHFLRHENMKTLRLSRITAWQGAHKQNANIRKEPTTPEAREKLTENVAKHEVAVHNLGNVLNIKKIIRCGCSINLCCAEISIDLRRFIWTSWSTGTINAIRNIQPYHRNFSNNNSQLHENFHVIFCFATEQSHVKRLILQSFF